MPEWTEQEAIGNHVAGEWRQKKLHRHRSTAGTQLLNNDTR
jgi:hypothetical protein